jgi:hypothetical protein
MFRLDVRGASPLAGRWTACPRGLDAVLAVEAVFALIVNMARGRIAATTKK